MYNIHSLRHKKGRKCGMATKIDLEKAYDCIDLETKGFNAHMKQFIMKTITSMKLQVCWNGEALEAFLPSRGLRQGDSLSPYLFLLCMKVLNFKIRKPVCEKQ